VTSNFRTEKSRWDEECVPDQAELQSELPFPDHREPHNYASGRRNLYGHSNSAARAWLSSNRQECGLSRTRGRPRPPSWPCQPNIFADVSAYSMSRRTCGIVATQKQRMEGFIKIAGVEGSR
jgi:hypothetical protein